MDHNSAKFKALKDKWYLKLEKSGFEDHELDENNLKWSTRSQSKQNLNKDREVVFRAKESYYRLVGHFLYDHKFTSDIDKKIWEYHSEGVSMRDTSKIMKSKHKVRIASTQVKESIHRTRELMLKKYKESL